MATMTDSDGKELTLEMQAEVLRNRNIKAKARLKELNGELTTVQANKEKANASLNKSLALIEGNDNIINNFAFYTTVFKNKETFLAQVRLANEEAKRMDRITTMMMETLEDSDGSFDFDTLTNTITTRLGAYNTTSLSEKEQKDFQSIKNEKNVDLPNEKYNRRCETLGEYEKVEELVKNEI